MKRYTFIVFVLLLANVIVAHAQKFTIYGTPKNSFTYEKIDTVQVTVMTADSTVVDQRTYIEKLGHMRKLGEVAQSGTFIIKLSANGFYDTYLRKNIHFRRYRKDTEYLGDVLMQALPRKVIQLREATVKATKLLMVMKGDTVVYNADAFQLAEGSMLDQLIAMLPGVKLDKGGVITVNGRKVSSLLVNGEEFFRGNPKVALDNLPAYMVDKVKVYERMDDRLRALGFDKSEVGKQPLVMDVNLKRQYSVGWASNFGADYGTQDRYGARLFALRFTTQSRIGAYANINNFMGGAYYDADGNWQSSSSGSLATTKDMGLYYLVNDRQSRYKIDGSTRFWYYKNPTESKTSSTTFFDPDDMYSRMRQRDVAHEMVADAAFNIQITPKKAGLYAKIQPTFNYKNYDDMYQSQSADWRAQLNERYMGEALDSLFGPNGAHYLRDNLISSLETHHIGKGHSFRTGVAMKGSFRIKNSSDLLNFGAGGNYDYDAERMLRTSASQSSMDAKPLQEVRFTDRNASNYDVYANIGYSYRLKFDNGLTFSVKPNYRYEHQYHSASNPYYKLENTGFASWDVDQLASNRSALQDQINAENTYYSTAWSHTHSGSVSLSLGKSKSELYRHWDFSVDLPIRHVQDKLDYERDRIDTLMRRSKTYFEPGVSFSFQPRNNDHFSLSYQYGRQAQNLTYQLNYEDTSTPLVVRLGTPGLKDTRTHSAGLHYDSWNDNEDPRYQSISLDVNYKLWLDALCQAMTYDAQTGVRTYRPSTINGNWEIGANTSYSNKLFPKKNVYINLNAHANYRNSADLLSLSEQSVRSSVRTLSTGSNMSLSAYGGRKGWGGSVSANFTYRHSVGNHMATMNVVDFGYGASVNIPLPWDVRLTTTARMYSRRGYADSRFNTDDLVWTARLNKSILKGTLHFGVEAFDILGQISSTAYVINAQMQTETWRNVLGRYFMLHVTYSLIRPEKKRTR